jgi:hypothetical protein
MGFGSWTGVRLLDRGSALGQGFGFEEIATKIIIIEARRVLFLEII